MYLKLRPPAPPAHPGSGRVWELTAPGAWSLRACLVEGEPGDHAAALEHEGEELVAVLTGQFQLCIGEQLYTLDAGDVAHYPAVSSHRLSPLARGARALIVLAPTA